MKKYVRVKTNTTIVEVNAESLDQAQEEFSRGNGRLIEISSTQTWHANGQVVRTIEEEEMSAISIGTSLVLGREITA